MRSLPLLLALGVSLALVLCAALVDAARAYNANEAQRMRLLCSARLGSLHVLSFSLPLLHSQAPQSEWNAAKRSAAFAHVLSSFSAPLCCCLPLDVHSPTHSAPLLLLLPQAESLIFVRVNDSPHISVLHFHSEVHDEHDEDEEVQPRSDGRIRVRMHTHHPLTGIAAQEGDTLTIAHSSLPGETVRLLVPSVGEWAQARFPPNADSSETEVVRARFMLMSLEGRTELLTADHNEWILPGGAAQQQQEQPFLPAVETIELAPASPERTERYKQHLGDRWPGLENMPFEPLPQPEPVQEDRDL